MHSPKDPPHILSEPPNAGGAPRGAPRLPKWSLVTMMSMVKLMVAMRTPRMKRKYQSSPTRNSCRFTHSKHPATGKTDC